MKLFMVVPYYLYWHYSRGLKEWAHNLFAFLSFEFEFFSVKDLLRTLFAPFQRLHEGYGNNPTDMETIFSALIVNTLMRAVGFVVRSCILTVAAISITASFLFILLLLTLWIFFPLVIIILIIGGTIASVKQS